MWGRSEIFQGKAIYGGRFDLSQKEWEIKLLKEQLFKAETEAEILRRNSNKGGRGGNKSGDGYNQPRRGGKRRCGGDRGCRGAGNGGYARGSDPSFETERAKICLHYNRGTCTNPNCNLSHVCD